MKITKFIQWATLLAMFVNPVILSGCARSYQKGPVFDKVNVREFPIEKVSLLSYSDRNFDAKGPAEDVARSLLAAQNVLRFESNNELANFCAARAAKWLIEFGGKEMNREQLAGLGVEWTEKLLAMDPERVEYVFLAGALLGFKIRENLHPSFIQLRKSHDLFERAVKMDPMYDSGAPLRALGMLLVNAPEWPTGVGDIDKGIEHLKKAVAMFPNHPANHLYLGLAYMEDEEYQKALKCFERTLELNGEFHFGEQYDQWKKEAKKYKKKAEKELKKD